MMMTKQVERYICAFIFHYFPFFLFSSSSSKTHTHFLFEKKTTILLCTYIHNACFLLFHSSVIENLFYFFCLETFFFFAFEHFFLIFVWCGPLQMSFFLHQTQYGSSHRQFPCEKKENPHDDHIFIIFEYAHTHKNHVFFNIINALGYERQTY